MGETPWNTVRDQWDSNPWARLAWHLDSDYAAAAVDDLLELMDKGCTANDIREYLGWEDE